MSVSPLQSQRQLQRNLEVHGRYIASLMQQEGLGNRLPELHPEGPLQLEQQQQGSVMSEAMVQQPPPPGSTVNWNTSSWHADRGQLAGQSQQHHLGGPVGGVGRGQQLGMPAAATASPLTATPAVAAAGPAAYNQQYYSQHHHHQQQQQEHQSQQHRQQQQQQLGVMADRSWSWEGGGIPPTGGLGRRRSGTGEVGNEETGDPPPVAGEGCYQGLTRRSSSTGGGKEVPAAAAGTVAADPAGGGGGGVVTMPQQDHFQGHVGDEDAEDFGDGGGGDEQGVFEGYPGTEGLPDSPNLLLHFPDLADLPDIMPDGGAVAGVAALEPPVLPDHDQDQHLEHLQQPLLTQQRHRHQQQQGGLRREGSGGLGQQRQLSGDFQPAVVPKAELS